MKNIFAMTLGIALLFSDSTNAAAVNNETVKSVMAEMNKLVKYINELGSKKAPLLALSVTLKKKNDLWHEQIEGQLPELKKQIIRLKTHAKDLKAVKKEKKRLEKWKKDIIGNECIGEVDGAVYERCRLEEERVNEKIAKNHIRKDELETDRKEIDAEKEKITKFIGGYDALIKANSKIMSENLLKHIKIDLDIKRHKKNQEYYRRRLIVLCAEADAALRTRTADMSKVNEALFHCHSINWDGANKNLPPLNIILRGNQFFGR